MSVRRASLARRPLGPWAWGSVLLIGVAEPVEQPGAGEAPLVAELAAGDLAGLRKFGQVLRVDAQQVGGLVQRHHLELLDRGEGVMADREAVVEALDYDAARAGDVVEVVLDQGGDEILLRHAQLEGGAVELLGGVIGEADVERAAVHIWISR